MGAPESAFETFLDRLMHAESNGRATAANPRSTALGPFQFIKSTFLSVMRRHFPEDVAKLRDREILALRTDHGFARRAAEAFSKDNMAYLAERGLRPTFGHLRLAFLLGPAAAARVLQATPTKLVSHVLDTSVIVANPFMRRMTVADLVARATRDVSPKGDRSTITARAEPKPRPAQPAAEAQPAEPARVAETGPDLPVQPAAPVVDEAARPAPVADTGPTAQPEQPAAVADVEPAAQPEPVKPVAEAKPRSEGSTTVARVSRGTTRQSETVAVINVTCNEKLASCRRWIDDQVAKVLRTKTAADETRPGV